MDSFDEINKRSNDTIKRGVAEKNELQLMEILHDEEYKEADLVTVRNMAKEELLTRIKN